MAQLLLKVRNDNAGKLSLYVCKACLQTTCKPDVRPVVRSEKVACQGPCCCNIHDNNAAKVLTCEACKAVTNVALHGKRYMTFCLHTYMQIANTGMQNAVAACNFGMMSALNLVVLPLLMSKRCRGS